MKNRKGNKRKEKINQNKDQSILEGKMNGNTVWVITNEAFVKAIKQDNVAFFKKYIEVNEIEVGDITNEAFGVLVNSLHGSSVLKILPFILNNDSLKIFKYLESSKKHFNIKEIFHLITIIPENKILEYCVNKEDVPLSFEGLILPKNNYSIITHLIAPVLKNVVEANIQTQLCKKLDIVLKALTTKDKNEVASIFSCFTKIPTPLSAILQIKDINIKQQLAKKLLSWMIENDHIKYINKWDIENLWRLKTESINSLIEKQCDKTTVLMELGKNCLIGESVSETGDKLESCLPTSRNIKNQKSFVTALGTSTFSFVDKEHIALSIYNTKQMYESSELFSENEQQIKTLVNENGESKVLFNIIAELIKYNSLYKYYATKETVKQSIHIYASVCKKHEALKVILKAMNSISFDENISLNELLSLTQGDELLVDTYLKTQTSVSINNQNQDGNTLLHFAVMHNNEYLVRKILYKGPKLDIKNNDDKTALDIATDFSKAEILDILNKYQNLQLIVKNDTCFIEVKEEKRDTAISKKEKLKTKCVADESFVCSNNPSSG